MDLLFDRILTGHTKDPVELKVRQMVEIDNLERLFTEEADLRYSLTYEEFVEGALRSVNIHNLELLGKTKEDLAKDLESFYLLSKRIRELVKERNIEVDMKNPMDVYRELSDDKQIRAYATSQWMTMCNELKKLSNI